MREREMKVHCVEKALRAVYRNAERAAEIPDEACIIRTLLRIRAEALSPRTDTRSEAQFLWRFLSAGAVAAAVLVGVALTNLSEEPLALNAQADDMVATVLNPTMPF
jgi:hypothetical protein